MSIIELKNVNMAFKQKKIFENVNLKIEEGACVGFVGSNGVGKSVLFQLISGLMQPSSGQIIINGKELGKSDNDFPEGVGILINSPGYIEYYSGFKNLQMLAEIQNHVGDAEIKNAMDAVGLDWKDKTQVRKYSMGMKQKLGIAQAIMENQSILILDEPYNALDFQTNKDITMLLRKMKEEGKTILLTSHQHEYLIKLCDKLYCIEEHNIAEFNENMRKKYFEI